MLNSADRLNRVYSPMADISCDPRWGKSAEGSREDPFPGSRITVAMVSGHKGQVRQDPSTVISCVKHLGLCGASEAGMDYNSLDLSLIEMYQNFFPHTRQLW